MEICSHLHQLSFTYNSVTGKHEKENTREFIANQMQAEIDHPAIMPSNNRGIIKSNDLECIQFEMKGPRK